MHAKSNSPLAVRKMRTLQHQLQKPAMQGLHVVSCEPIARKIKLTTFGAQMRTLQHQLQKPTM
jgi:hypothetical protein